jgi:hypothetical protein
MHGLPFLINKTFSHDSVRKEVNPLNNDDLVEEAIVRMFDHYRMKSSITIELALREAFLDGAQFALDRSTQITNEAFDNLIHKIKGKE